MWRFVAVGVVVPGLWAVRGVPAQQAAPAIHTEESLPSFEVATIKPFDPSGRLIIYPPGMKQETLLPGTARMLIARAYNMMANSKMRVLGGPAWIDNDRYVIDGKIPDDLFAKMQTMKASEKEQQIIPMLRSLLVERFKLKVHTEMREMPVYELVAAKDGPKMDALKPIDEGVGSGGMSWGHGAVRAGGRLEDIFQMAPFGLEGRPIINKTGLTGTYRINLKWSPPPMPGMNPAAQAAQSEEPQESIFTVVQEQLGLKLVPAKDQVEVIVIDHVEMPSAN